MKYQNLFIGLLIMVLFYMGSTYLYEGQEESTAMYAKRHIAHKSRY